MRLIGAAIVVLGLLAWAWRVDQRAEIQAKEFCNGVTLESSFAEVAETAKTVGDDHLRSISEDLILVGFTGIPPFSRHACVIRGGKDGVESKRYVHLD